MVKSVIDVNSVEDDVLEVPMSVENISAKDAVERMAQEMFGKSMQEIYLGTILEEIQALRLNPDKTPQDREKLLNYLKQIDAVCWYSKSKQDIKITTPLKSMSDIYKGIED